VKVGIHARFQHWNFSKLLKLGGVRVVVEGAGDENIETGVGSFTRRGDKIGPTYGAELRSD